MPRMSEAKSGVQACLTAAGRQGEYGAGFCSHGTGLLSIVSFAVQSFGRAEKKSWYVWFHKKQLRVAPLRRSQETRSKATKFRTAELVVPGFVMV